MQANAKKVVFLVSGNGGTLKFIYRAIQQLNLPLEVSGVFADRDCGALAFAQTVGLPHQQLRYTRKAPEELQEALRRAAPDVVVTNIHKIIDADTLGLCPGRFINLHYSILPAFKGFIGMETVEQARLLNVTILGATCHEVDELVDNGKCLSQVALGVDWANDDTGKVYDLVFRAACLALLQGLIKQVQLPGTPDAAVLPQLGRTLLFAPALTFAASNLDEAFWQSVK